MGAAELVKVFWSNFYLPLSFKNLKDILAEGEKIDWLTEPGLIYI